MNDLRGLNMSENVVKLLKDVTHDIEKNKKEIPAEPQSEFRDLCIPIQRIKIVRDGNIVAKMHRWPITTPQAALALFREFFKEADREICAIMTFNLQNEWIGITTANMGSLDSVDIDLFEIFKIVATDNAAAFIVAHNHPSGIARMSDDDWKSFHLLKEQGLKFRRPMLDFLILADGNDTHYSVRENHYEAF